MRHGLTVRMVVAGAVLVAVVAATVEASLTDLETGLRGYVITGEQRFLEPWTAAVAALPARTRALEQLTSDNPDELRRSRSIVAGIETYVRTYGTPLVAAVGRRDPSASSIPTTEQ